MIAKIHMYIYCPLVSAQILLQVCSRIAEHNMNRNNLTYCLACCSDCIVVVYRKEGMINDCQHSSQKHKFLHFISLDFNI